MRNIAIVHSDLGYGGGRLPLDEELRLLGVPTLPMERVREHKQAVRRKYRPENHRFLALFGRGVQALLGLLTLYSPIERLVQDVDKRAEERTWLWYGISMVLLPIIAESLVYFAGMGSTTIVILLAIPLTTWAITVLYVLLVLLLNLAYDVSWVDSGSDRWKKYKVDLSSPCWAYSVEDELPPVPMRLQGRVGHAASIPGVRILVEGFHTDPFIIARRGRWLFAKDVYIGAWDTGDPLLDNA